MTACVFAYIDLGSNRGDSLERFVRGTPDVHVLKALQAVMPGWTPNTSCMYAFEANPKWTPRLLQVQQQLRPSVSRIEVHTETAIVDDNRSKAQLFLDPSPFSEGTSVAHGKRKGRKSVFVRALNLHHWLIQLPSMPAVIRMDVEGLEYSLLSSLLVRGTVSHLASLHIAVEWHRYAKHASIGAETAARMRSLDLSYMWVKGKNAPLEDSLEKQLHYWLKTAGVDLFY